MTTHHHHRSASSASNSASQAATASATGHPHPSYFEQQRGELIRDIALSLDQVLQNVNRLNRNLESIISVGNEFSSVEALWSQFEGVMGNQAGNGDAEAEAGAEAEEDADGDDQEERGRARGRKDDEDDHGQEV